MHVNIRGVNPRIDIPNWRIKLKQFFTLMIAKQLAVSINKNNTTAVSAASKAQINITKSKILLSK